MREFTLISLVIASRMQWIKAIPAAAR